MSLEPIVRLIVLLWSRVCHGQAKKMIVYRIDNVFFVREFENSIAPNQWRIQGARDPPLHARNLYCLYLVMFLCAECRRRLGNGLISCTY